MTNELIILIIWVIEPKFGRNYNMDAKLMIHSLKNGIVPKSSVDSILVSREAEIIELQRNLDLVAEGNGSMKFISGDYGVGKSFLLQHVHNMATRQNFIVSRLQLNHSFTLNKWDELYYQFMHNLSIESVTITEKGFEEIFNQWIKKLQSYEDSTLASKEIYEVTQVISQYHGDFARVFISFIRAKIQKDIELMDATSSWIKGEKNMPQSLKTKFGIKGHVDRNNALDFLKAFIKLSTLLGYQGIILLIDELETALHVRSDIRQVIYENLRFLFDSCISGEIHNCMFLLVGTNELLQNSERGIPTYEPLAQRLRITASSLNNGFTDVQPVIHLKSMQPEDLTTLTAKILVIYEEANDWKSPFHYETIRNWVLFSCREGNELKFPMNIRVYIQKLIDILDILAQGKELPLLRVPLQLVHFNGRYSFVNKKSEVTN
ncbi:hypothetical protein BHU72_06775 [Desulfuribacillus stibiiarsenatis]|uniref:ATPase domain-containing protein n=1 Tax=Desulfuribacillus stibiiarsenatis TaxID=1390249 RepID=A0A1E5L433_9FIRM|nr:BREX system ATP-binding domain-containing protein [Desulfuribacillus stibiiarsenatis]OEH84892.1 hypothetical protein BHU72_06775 [Desulfuribacillus stibiiarsenatis]